MAAGVALENAARLFFTYKGAMFWKMQAGMGDVVFAPLYEVLRRRGVQFRFFHRVTGLRLAADRRSIGAIDMARQVELVNPDVEYEPLEDVEGLPCWPAEPRWAQVRDADRVRGTNLESFWAPSPDAAALTLTAGRDFDRVIFGISLGAVPYLCRELIDASARWRAMVEHVGTVPTQAFQVWLTATTQDLGWPWPLSNMSSFVEPFDTYADMSHLLDRERWPAGERAGSVAYFCNALHGPESPAAAPDPAYAATAEDAVKANAVEFLRRWARHLWPASVDPATGEFRWELLAGAAPPATRRASTRSSGAPTSTRPTTTSCPFPAPAAIASSPARRASTTWSSRETGPTAGSTPAASRPPSSPVAWPPTR